MPSEAALKLATLILRVNDIIDDIGVFPTANYADLAAFVEAVRTRLIDIEADTSVITWGDITGIIDDIGVFPTANYATFAAFVEDVRTRLIAIPTVMVGTDGAATVADGWDAALATILDNFTGVLIGNLGQLDFDLQGFLDIITALVDSAEAAGPFSYLDAGGEQDVYEDAAVTRRRIWIVVSNRNMTQTGTFRIYRKVNGANYDLYIDQPVLIAAGKERAWDREFTTNQAWKITYEEDVDETANRDIPYNVITQVIE